MPTIKFKLALKYAFYSYVAIFILGGILGYVIDVDMTINDIPTTMWYGGMIITAIVSSIFATLYLKKFPCPGIVTGAMFGVVTILFGFAIDAIFFGLAHLTGDSPNIFEYYADPFFFATLLIAFIMPALVGYYFRHTR